MRVSNVIHFTVGFVFALAATGFSFTVPVNDSSEDTLIIGGANAEDGQFPYQVSLRKKKTVKNHQCGASIISNRFLLTAAHCVEEPQFIPIKPELFVAVVGSSRISEGGIEINIDKITPHESFDFDHLTNDIALMRTLKEIVFSEIIQPIALPVNDRPDRGGTPTVVTGWGATSVNGEKPDVLQYYSTPTINLRVCTAVFEKINVGMQINKNNVCTLKETGVGVCAGDTGGPLVDITDQDNRYLIGIVSWGIPCGKGYPDVFTRVFSYVDWINKKMEEQSSF